MKFILYNIFLPLICLILTTCVKRDTSIGILVNDNLKNYWDTESQYFIKKSDENKIPLYIKFFNDNNINEKYHYLLNKNINVLIIHSKNNSNLKNIIKDCRIKNIKVISYEYLLKNCDVDIHISFDEEKIGYLQTKYLIEQKPKGNYVIIGGIDGDENSLLLELGQKEALSKDILSGNIKLIYQSKVNNNNSSEGYINMMKSFSKNPNIDVVLTSDDKIAEGVIKAIAQKNIKHKILVAGQGVSAETCFRIMEGEQEISTYKPIDVLSEITFKVAYELSKHNKMINYNTLLNNESSKLIPAILLPSIIISKNTIKTTVIQPVN